MTVAHFLRGHQVKARLAGWQLGWFCYRSFAKNEEATGSTDPVEPQYRAFHRNSLNRKAGVRTRRNL